MRDGWIEFKLKDVASVNKGKLPKNKNEQSIGIPYLTANFLRTKVADFWIEELDGVVQAKQGDCLILWDGAGAGDLFKAVPGVVSSTMALVTLKKQNILNDYLTLVISSKESYIKETCRGTTVPHVAPDAIDNMILKIPPLPEQIRIVDLISSVDSYIESLEKQLETGKSSRNAILHEFFSSPGKDWRRDSISNVSILIKRGNAPSYTDKKSVTVLNQKCIRYGKIDVKFSRQTDQDIRPIKEWAYLKIQDSIINSTGVGTLGRAAYVQELNEPTTVDSHITIVRPNLDLIEPAFLGVTLNFKETDLVSLGTGSSGQTELSREAIGNLIIDLPPIPEQKRIVEIIYEIDKFMDSAEKSIDEGKKLRSGLLSELLSGEHEIPASYDKVMSVAS